MPKPSCPKCGNATFEIVEHPIRNARFAHNLICCAACGAVVGTEERLSVTYMLSKIAAKLDVRFDS